ncbi:hypothetical protein sos41_31170 [Alphaproteobacteria bacterium SO-S41]|nr:hypothetical protein sos41_31170 [Alphaproteobacteria bacterium SO-S41]
MASKQACFQREKSALARSGTAYSYWHTPTASASGNHVTLHIRPDGARFKANDWLNSTQVSPMMEAHAWTLLYLTMKAAGASFSKEQASCPSSPPVQVSLLPGTALSRRALTYNPAFTDWMMGWPMGWTAPEAPVTGFAAWLQRMRGELSRLPCA